MTGEFTLDRPSAYHLPFHSWWKNQEQMTKEALTLSKDEVLFLEAPTGNGKSAVPALVSHFRPGTVVCVATRDLQQQYADSFDFFALVWGREHYDCALRSWIEEFATAYDQRPTRADCPFRKPKDCPVLHNCPYEQAKTEALRARAVVLNYAYAYYTNWWRMRRADLFCDEAHILPRILSDLISIEVSEHTRQFFGLPEFPLLNGGSLVVLRSLANWLGRAVDILSTLRPSDKRLQLRAANLRLRLEALREDLVSSEPGHWYIASSRVKGRLTAKPVLPFQYPLSDRVGCNNSA